MNNTPQAISQEMMAVADELSASIAASVRAIQEIARRIEALDREMLPAPVPYRSQWESDALRFASDCGPACVAMLIQHVTGERVPIDALAGECGMGERQNTFAADLIRCAWGHGVKLATLIVTSVRMMRTPGIALVHYAALPRMDSGYTRGHWVVVTRVDDDEAWYHDPDWWGTRMSEGENRRVTVEQFDGAMKECTADGNPAGLVLVIA